MIYKEKPENFNPVFDDVCCFVESKNKILLLKRQENKTQPNKFGIPSGKVAEKENLDQECNKSNSKKLEERQKKINLL